MGIDFTGVAGAASRLYSGITGTSPVKNENERLLEEIKNARSEVERAEAIFNELTDNAAIDYAAYNIMAAKAKYSYLIILAKEKNLRF